MQQGTIRKLKSEITENNIVNYRLPLGDEEVELNPLIGKKVALKFLGNIYCLDTDKKIKKSYGQGYSWESFVTLPQCDQCIVQPERCHFSKGTCRDPEWGEKNCFQPHVIYLSLTSGLKIGITRGTQVPTRWIDQGAVRAIKLCTVKDRLTSGLIETTIAKDMADKTNWRNMLKNVYEDVDLVEAKKTVIKKFSKVLEGKGAEIADDKLYEFNYPVEQYPEKVSSMSFDKKEKIEGTLMGVKGQYLIFDCGVINMRKHQGYEISIEW